MNDNMIEKDAQIDHNQDSVTEAANPYAVPVPPPTSQEESNGGYESNNNTATFQIGTDNRANRDDENVKAEFIANFEKAKSAVFDNGGYPLLVLLCSIIVMIASANACSESCNNTTGYVVAASVISILVSLAFVFLEKKQNLQPKVRLYLVAALWLWWTLLACISTFPPGPFTLPGNGYFFSWIGMIITTIMLMNEVGKVRQALDRFSNLGHKYALLIVGSLVVFFGGLACTTSCGSLNSYAIAVGIISFVFTVVRIFLEQKITEKMDFYWKLFIVIWWTVGFFILTFAGPFQDVGNGYFGTVLCVTASVLLWAQKNETEDDVITA